MKGGESTIGLKLYRKYILKIDRHRISSGIIYSFSLHGFHTKLLCTWSRVEL